MACDECEEYYKKGFMDGVESCKNNKKLDDAIKPGTEL